MLFAIHAVGTYFSVSRMFYLLLHFGLLEASGTHAGQHPNQILNAQELLADRAHCCALCCVVVNKDSRCSDGLKDFMDNRPDNLADNLDYRRLTIRSGCRCATAAMPARNASASDSA